MNADNGSNRLNPVVAAAIAVMVFSLLGIAAIARRLPGAQSQKTSDAALAESPVDADAGRCSSCGTVSAIAGHEVEENLQKHRVYRVTVRMDDGSFRTVSQSVPPVLAVGDKVRIERGALLAAGS